MKIFLSACLISSILFSLLRTELNAQYKLKETIALPEDRGINFLIERRTNIQEAEKSRFFKRSLQDNKLFPGSDNVDVSYYGLKFFIDHAASNIKASADITLSSAREATSSFTLELSNALQLDSLIAGGIRTPFTHQSDQISFEVKRKYQPSEKLNITVYYHGNPASSGWGSFRFDTHNGSPAVWTLSEPFGAPDWFPCNDRPSDKADSSDVTVRIASGLQVASNGSLVSTTVNDDNTTTWHWKNRHPIAPYLISLAIADYNVYTDYFRYSENDSMPVVHYIYPEHSTPQLRQRLSETVKMLEVFSDLFGLYPFIDEKYGHAEFGWGGGMEHQTISSMGAFSRDIISHELAHQWFGDLITCAGWSHIWLNEGFASYAEALYLEAIYDREEYDYYLSGVMNIAKSARGSLFVRDTSSIDQIFDYARSYQKGSAVLHMLRGVTGDSLFFKILRAYLYDERFRGKTATTEDFQGVAQLVSGMDLNYFFSQWIYGEGYPDYRIRWDYSPASGSSAALNNNPSSHNYPATAYNLSTANDLSTANNPASDHGAAGSDTYRIDLEIRQQQNTSPRVFTMPIKIKLYTNAGDTAFTIFNDKQQQSFSFIVKGVPDRLFFDPENLILKNVFIEHSPYSGEQPLSFQLKQNYPNPFNPGTTISFILPVESSVELKLFDPLGRQAAVIMEGDLFKAGEQQVRIDAQSLKLPSGIYFYRLKAKSIFGQEEFTQTRKMVLIR